MHGKSHDNRGIYLIKYHAKPKVTAKQYANIPKVNAQSKVEEKIQISIYGKKYSIKKSAVKEIDHNDIWWKKLNISA